MVKITKLFVPDAMQEQKELFVPLVITKVTDDVMEVYHGFVPGLTKEDCVSMSQKTCMKLLKEDVEKLIDKYLEEGLPFPFFPTEEEIYNDFDDVCEIKMIKL